MINDVIKYLMDSAPGLAVSLAMVVYVIKRMAQLESRLCSMLENCMNRVFEHLESDDK